MNSVSKKPIIGGIILAAIIGVVFVGAEINPDNPENEEVVFHVTLADPALYELNNGRYFDNFMLEEGWYEFRFVANGDSPEVLTVSIKSDPFEWFNILFEETFTLKGIPHESETSLYYTWDYDGQKKFLIKETDMGERGQFQIEINPNGNFNGPVSVDLIKLRGLEGVERILG